MDLVLGLSLTSATAHWVLVAGTTGEGDPIDRGEVDLPSPDDLDADVLLDAVLNPDVVADNRIRVVGVTSTDDAESAAAAVVHALAGRGHHDVTAVSDVSAVSAVAALADGISGLTAYGNVAVCVVEPDSAFVALVDGGEVRVETIDRPADRADALELTSSVIAVLDLGDREPDAIFVIGSDDVEVVVDCFEAITDAPVFSAAEADLALARGAALVAARTIDMSGAVTPRRSPRTGVLVGVLAAAVVTFVASVSLAICLTLSPHPTDRPERLSVAVESVPSVSPVPTRPTPRFPDAANVVAKTMAVAVPPAPPPIAAPVSAPPPAAQPPVYRAPAPAYVPPSPPRPRLRDRIIDHIPIIGRFHDQGQ
ncbi:MAG: hypothetical protein M3O32_21560 [Actinomycetota bacterium]|nr:hypothetical protein [Actinomycetota bacterium]